MNSLLCHEQIREAHEMIDFIEDTITQELLSIPRQSKDRLVQEHYVASLLDLAHSKSRDILDFYQESNTKRTQELTTLTTENALDLTPFYAHLQQLRQHHRPASSNAPASLSLATPIQEVIPVRKGSSESLDILFSGEEHFGKYLDCNSLYTQYCNLKNVVPRDYLSFIDLLDNFDHISEWLKKEKTYLEYLKAVQAYLLDFYKRAKPLYNTEELLKLSEKKLRRRFDDLQNDLLYCKNCEKRFVKETVFKAHLTGKKHLEATKHHVEPANRPVTDSILLLESNIRELYGPLKAIKNATIANIERKQSLTVEELALEEEEEEFDELEVLQEGLDETEETDKLYNPLKLPLGWDGKPIPYWLYKLHGLSVNYTCEICGNYTYMGRKAFEKHFQEWRHAQGMKCLGLPNTKHFQEITTIKDALILADKLKEEAKKEVFRRDTMEEFEDKDGNVFNRKTFEDLHRQGLL